LPLSPNIIRQIKSGRIWCAGHVARVGEERKVYKVLVGKPEGKRPLGRLRRRWEMGSKWILVVCWEGVGCINLTEDRDRWRACVNTVKNLRVLAPRSYLLSCHCQADSR
jgi:hypothetical protein